MWVPNRTIPKSLSYQVVCVWLMKNCWLSPLARISVSFFCAIITLWIYTEQYEQITICRTVYITCQSYGKVKMWSSLLKIIKNFKSITRQALNQAWDLLSIGLWNYTVCTLMKQAMTVCSWFLNNSELPSCLFHCWCYWHFKNWFFSP